MRGALLLILLAAGWGAGSALSGGRRAGWGPRTGRIRVLTTIFPLYDFAREVGGPAADVRNLLPPGVDPHEFALSPRDVKLVAGADLLIANGGLDSFLAEAVRKAGLSDRHRAKIVEVTQGLPKLESSERGESGETGDPHLWLDPELARTYVRRIAEALESAAADPRGLTASNGFRERAAALDTALVQLDAEYRDSTATLRDRPFVAFHGAFAYLARRYGLQIAGVWQRSPGREPGPRDVAEILARARAGRVVALFAEPQLSPRALEMIAADAGLPVYTLDPLETARDFRTGRYLDGMRANLATLVRALSSHPTR